MKSEISIHRDAVRDCAEQGISIHRDAVRDCAEQGGNTLIGTETISISSIKKYS